MTVEPAQTAKTNQNSVVLAEKSSAVWRKDVSTVLWWSYGTLFNTTLLFVTQVHNWKKSSAMYCLQPLRTHPHCQRHPPASKQVLKCLLKNLSMASFLLHLEYTCQLYLFQYYNRCLKQINGLQILQCTWVNWRFVCILSFLVCILCPCVYMSTLHTMPMATNSLDIRSMPDSRQLYFCTHCFCVSPCPRTPRIVKG